MKVTSDPEKVACDLQCAHGGTYNLLASQRGDGSLIGKRDINTSATSSQVGPEKRNVGGGPRNTSKHSLCGLLSASEVFAVVISVLFLALQYSKGGVCRRREACRALPLINAHLD